MIITTQRQLEEAVQYFGILPFFRNKIRGFSIEEMTPPSLLFGGNEYEGCWEWKGPVVRQLTSAYGKFFHKKAGFVSKSLLPYFLKFRCEGNMLKPGTIDEMIYDIISINDKMSSTELRESMLGTKRRRTPFDLPDIEESNSNLILMQETKKPSRHSLDGPLQRLQMAGRLCISDFRYKLTSRGERYGWGVAEYSTPETLFPELELPELCAEECLNHMVETVGKRFKRATEQQLISLLKS